MDDNNFLMIILAFIVGYCLQGMMKNMCGGRLVEGALGECTDNSECPGTDVCDMNYCSRANAGHQPPHCQNLTAARSDLLPQPIPDTKSKWWYKKMGDCLNLTGSGVKKCNNYGGKRHKYCGWSQQ